MSDAPHKPEEPIPPGSFSPVTAGAKIDKPTAWVMAVLFVAFITIPALHQFVIDCRAGNAGALWQQFLAALKPFPTHEKLKTFETNVARDSALASDVRHGYQTFLASAFSSGSDSVYIGRDGWLFFRREMDLSAGPGFLSEQFLGGKRNAHVFEASEDIFTRQFRIAFTREKLPPVPDKNQLPVDPVPAIADLAEQLKARGAHLIVVPVPAKPAIYPEKVAAGYSSSAGPAWNVDRAKFFAALAARDIDAIDLTDDLWNAKAGGDVFLRTDTHWSPRGLDVAANAIAAKVKGHAAYKQVTMKLPATMKSTMEITTYGDLHDNLFNQRDSSFAKETVAINRMTNADGSPLLPGDDAQILLLGDSYANIYASDSLAWGSGAGLPQQLMRRLDTPIQTISRNGGGATQVREMLAASPKALAKKQVVIWEFSTRELYDMKTEWPLIRLREPPKVAKVPTTQKAILPAVIEARITELGSVPQPKDNYPRAFRIVRVEVLGVESGAVENTSLYVILQAMENNALTPLGTLPAGQKLRVTLRNETPAESQIRRTSVENEDIDLPAPLMAEKVELLSGP